jgi:hypothetical protein
MVMKLSIRIVNATIYPSFKNKRPPAQSPNLFQDTPNTHEVKENLFGMEKYFHYLVATNWDIQEKTASELLQWHNNQGGDAEKRN